jgi:hypothetical protein
MGEIIELEKLLEEDNHWGKILNSTTDDFLLTAGLFGMINSLFVHPLMIQKFPKRVLHIIKLIF